MRKEKQILDYEQLHEHEKKAIIEELLKLSPMALTTAYLYALNYTLYGEDVTEKWLTTIQQTNILEKAYRKGYYDAMQRQAERTEE